MLHLPDSFRTGHYEDQDISNCNKDSGTCCEVCCMPGAESAGAWAFVRGEITTDEHRRFFDPFWLHQNLRIIRGMPPTMGCCCIPEWGCCNVACGRCQDLREAKIIQATFLAMAHNALAAPGPPGGYGAPPAAAYAAPPPGYQGVPPPGYGGPPPPAYGGPPPPQYGGPPPPGYAPPGYAPPEPAGTPDGGYAPDTICRP